MLALLSRFVRSLRSFRVRALKRSQALDSRGAFVGAESGAIPQTNSEALALLPKGNEFFEYALAPFSPDRSGIHNVNLRSERARRQPQTVLEPLLESVNA